MDIYEAFELVKKDETKAIEISFQHVHVISYFFYHQGVLKAFIEDVCDKSLISLEDKRLLTLMHFDILNWLTNFTKPIQYLIELNLVSLEDIFKQREVNEVNNDETDFDSKRSKISFSKNLLHGVSVQEGAPC